MNLNKWTNTISNRQIGNTTAIGSPRGWVYRSVDSTIAENFRNKESHPGSITLGGIWIRPCKLPDLGPHYSIYRYFELPLNWAGSGRTFTETESVIGVGISVPVDQMMEYHRRLVQSNARWIWASMPNCPDGLVPNGQLSCKSNDRIRLDHEYIYQLFDGGASISDVLNQYQTSRTAIEYIHTKWKNKLPARIAKKPLDWDAIMTDVRAGLPAQEIANKHNTTRTSVYNIQKKYQSV